MARSNAASRVSEIGAEMRRSIDALICDFASSATAAADQPLDPELIDEIAYVTATLADGFAASWLTYGDRGAALKQIDIATSVLETWLTARLESVPAR